METIGISEMISFIALAVSALSLNFATKSWRESNRPLVTARVTSFGKGGNVSIPLSLLVENTGSRPAKNISLKVEDGALDKALLPYEKDDKMVEAIKLCFLERGVISILANDKAVGNGFGMLQGPSRGTWTPDSKFDITIQYEDLDGRKFSHTNPLLIADDSGFAGTF